MPLPLVEKPELQRPVVPSDTPERIVFREVALEPAGPRNSGILPFLDDEPVFFPTVPAGQAPGRQSVIVQLFSIGTAVVRVNKVSLRQAPLPWYPGRRSPPIPPGVTFWSWYNVRTSRVCTSTS